MAPRRTTKRPSMQWDGHLYRPVKFGDRARTGTVDWAKRERQQRAHVARVQRVFQEHDKRAKQPAPFYLTSWPFLLVRAIGKLVTRLGR